jgi:hypothetical protein
VRRGQTVGLASRVAIERREHCHRAPSDLHRFGATYRGSGLAQMGVMSSKAPISIIVLAALAVLSTNAFAGHGKGGSPVPLKSSVKQRPALWQIMKPSLGKIYWGGRRSGPTPLSLQVTGVNGKRTTFPILHKSATGVAIKLPAMPQNDVLEILPFIARQTGMDVVAAHGNAITIAAAASPSFVVTLEKTRETTRGVLVAPQLGGDWAKGAKALGPMAQLLGKRVTLLADQTFARGFLRGLPSGELVALQGKATP